MEKNRIVSFLEGMYKFPDQYSGWRLNDKTFHPDLQSYLHCIKTLAEHPETNTLFVIGSYGFTYSEEIPAQVILVFDEASGKWVFYSSQLERTTNAIV